MKRSRLFSVIALVALVASMVAMGRLATAHEGGADNATPDASPMANIDTGTGAAYLTITNNGDEDDTLIAASTDVAKVVEIHDMVMENDTMSMVELEDGLVVPAGETVELKPKSLHVMLMGLNMSLMPGESFEITLTFEHAGDVTVTAVIGDEAPADAESYEVGDLVVEGVWSRPAPMLTSPDGEGTPDATPAH